MVTNWKTIANKMIEEEGLDEDVMRELEDYFRTFAHGLRTLDSVDYEFLNLGTFKPVTKFMNWYKASLDNKKESGIIKEFNSNQEDFLDFFHRWEQVMQKTRHEIKGQFNPFKKKL